MAVTQNTYTGNGQTDLYSFTFPYLETTDIKVSLDGSVTNAYSLANATTIQFNTAPANGVAIRIYRQTDDADLAAQFYPGSAIRSQDLNDNFTQNLYVTQESNREAEIANTTADSAVVTANSAVTTANAATATANTASSNASAAVATANTASSNASAAVSTANTASSNATTAVNTANAATATANSAASDAATAISTANGAVTTANSAAADAATAISTANTASSNASAAVSTANTASTNATTAVSSANSAVTAANNAVTAANSAVTTANAADGKADQAIAAVANAILYTVVADIVSIPGSPSNNDAIEVTDATGIESFTPLAGIPAGFTGDSGLSVRILYSSAGSTWNWVQYFANDSDDRYLATAGDTMTGALGVTAGSAASPSVFISGDTNTGIYSPGADQVAISTNGTGRLFVDASGNVAIGSGSISPSKLHVESGSLSVQRYGLQGAVILRRAEGTSDSPTAIVGNVALGDVRFRGYDGSTYRDVANIGVFSDGAISSASSPGYFAIGTTPSSSTSPQERLRLTSDGKLGLGVSSPGAKFQINAQDGFRFDVGANSYSYMQFGSAASGEGSAEIGFERTTGSTYLKNGANTSLTTRVTLDAAGNVGIGTTAPGTLLQVNAATAVDAYIRTTNASATGGFDFGVASSGDAYLYNRNNKPLIFGTNNSEYLRVTSTGNVGINTNAPGAKLEVYGSARLGGDNTTALPASSAGGGVHLSWNRSSGSAEMNFYNIYDNALSSFEFLQKTGASTASTLYNMSTSGHTWYVSNAEKARIDTSGRLLLGTSSAITTILDSPKLQIFVGDQGCASFTRGSDNEYGPNIHLTKSRNTAPGSRTALVSGDELGNIFFVGDDGSDLNQAGARIGAYVDGTPGADDMPGRLVFSTTPSSSASPVERMRIGSTGNTFIYATAVENLSLGNTATAGTSTALLVGRYSSTGYATGTASFVVWTNGNVVNTNNSYGSLSDIKLKENIVDANSQWGDLKALQVRNYNFKEGQTHTQIGLIAQEVELVSPGLVSESPDLDEDGNDLGTVTKSVNYSVLYMKAVKALQEAMERIEVLEAKVNALEGN